VAADTKRRGQLAPPTTPRNGAGVKQAIGGNLSIHLKSPSSFSMSPPMISVTSVSSSSLSSMDLLLGFDWATKRIKSQVFVA
jgi:hypothetical protein